MILSKLVLVKSSKYYDKLGYNIDDKYIKVNISDIPKGSHAIILAKCDYCISEKEVSYRDYNKNISINGKFSCSIKCGVLKSKETNLVKYGVESTNQLESKKLKSKESVINKYGVDHISKLESTRESKRIKMKLQKDKISKNITEYWSGLVIDDISKINEKREISNLAKYGFKHVSQVKEFKDKVRETNLERYGGYTYQSEILMNKVITTNLERYGVTYSSSSDIVKSNLKKSNFEKYGVSNPSKLKVFTEKAKNTNFYRYGVENIMLSEDFRSKYDISKEDNYIKYIGNRNYEFLCNTCDSSFIIDYDNYYKRKIRNVSRCTNCFPISEVSSIKEIELRNFIKSVYNDEIISNYRDGLEIDVYLPKLNIGFEFNGLYWHSKLDKNYHINKTNHFKKIGIRIIHIWEDDWDIRKDIVKSQIRNWIESPINRIYARKCSIRNVEQLEYKNFLNKNHIQGFIRSKIKIGLFYNDELVSLMTFDNLEGRKKMEEGGWNLSRFCSSLNTSVIGGSSKLLSHFINEYKPNRIISFADLDWSTGDLYYKLGFNISNILKPDYKYINNNIRLNKQKFTKKKLKNMGWDISKTESQITKEIGLSKIYNCGQLKFEIII